jgi:hypothetical protein
MNRRGFLLPTVLLLVVGFTALAMAALALALAEHRSTEWERGWFTPERSTSRTVVELGRGYRVVADSGALAVALQWVEWCLDPEAVAGEAWDASIPGPRLGPLAAADLVRLALEAGGWPLPADGTGAALVVAGSGAGGDPHPADTLRILNGERAVLVGADGGGAWLLVASGELEVEGPGELPGAVIAGGTFHLKRGAQVRGGVRAGALELEADEEGLPDGNPVHPDSALVAEALGLLPRCPIPVHGLGRLGRY